MMGPYSGLADTHGNRNTQHHHDYFRRTKKICLPTLLMYGKSQGYTHTKEQSGPSLISSLNPFASTYKVKDKVEKQFKHNFCFRCSFPDFGPPSLAEKETELAMPTDSHKIA